MRVLAVDLGATSGKICIIEKKRQRLNHYEISRFATRGLTLLTKLRPILFWNLPRFFEQMLAVISSEKILAVGIDSWGVDFGLFDAWGRLIGLPVHYRDPRTINIMDKLPISTESLFYRTGISPMPINSLFQLYAMVLQNDPVLNIARVFLMIPDIFNFWLTGECFCEYTIATTSQCLSLQGYSWAYDILEVFNIPREIFPPIIKPGVIIGQNKYPGLGKFKVIATASHDTAAAIASI
ncbi:MAG: FGGY family carbohydrate kinase, partial [Candidatus Bathyarchaeia archaeon]